MYQITIKSHFSAAHQLRDYEGECENLHGHNWLVEVFVEGDELEPNGLLIDFREMKKITGDVLVEIDHRNLNEVPPFTEANPTSENLARWLFRRILDRLADRVPPLRLSKVMVWESETSGASYSEDSQ